MNRAESAQGMHQSVSGRAARTSLFHHIMNGDGGQLIVLLLAVFAVAPLAYPGFFQSHSGFLPIYNLYDLEQSSKFLGLGWMPAVGMELDLFRGGGLLPYAIAEVFRWMGMSGPQAIMASFGASFLVAAWVMHRWIRRWLGSEAALLAAVLYTYLPYHLMTVYVRGNLAEAWVIALLPASLWAAHGWCAGRRSWLNLLYIAVSFALLCLANLGLALLWLPVLIGYLWICGHFTPRWGWIPVMGSAGILAGVAHAWSVRTTPTAVFEDHFPYLFQLVSPAWNTTGQTSDWLNPVPLQIGLAALGLSLLAVALLVAGKESGPEPSGHSGFTASSAQNRKVLWYWLVIAGVLFALMLSPLGVLWRLTGWDSLLTYPWQLMGYLGVAVTALGGSVMTLDARLRSVLVRAGLVTFVTLSSYGYLAPRFWDFDVDFTPEGKIAHVYSMPPRQSPLAIFGDHQVALLDVQLEGPLRHGATVRANVLWQALRPIESDYTVFIHAIDGDNNIWGQRDTVPLNGEYPTFQWGEGEIVPDRYEFRIDFDGPREGYGLAIGLYDTDSGERLSLPDGATRWVLRGE